jgi:hypothetical protein
MVYYNEEIVCACVLFSTSLCYDGKSNNFFMRVKNSNISSILNRFHLHVPSKIESKNEFDI